jgi:hypothetical protein
MTTKDEWDDGPAPDPIAVKARNLLSLQAQIDSLELQAKGLRHEIAAVFPAGIGTYTKPFGDLEITLARNEKWSWDKSAIGKIIAGLPTGDPLLEEISRAILDNVAIHKSAFAKLSAEAQKKLRAALTVKDGPFKISVEEKAT